MRSQPEGGAGRLTDALVRRLHARGGELRCASRVVRVVVAGAVGGAINGGTAKLHQQLVFRPLPGLGRPETPVRGLYLGSASAHPGGGAHGAPGANAARALLARRRLAPAAIVQRLRR
jgi:phytoene dehydrogenase-like protein